MQVRPVKVLSTIACLALTACDEPTRPGTEGIVPSATSNADVVAEASGGANWDLLGFDLTGDGVDDPIGNVLGFNAVRYADGSVSGQIEYQQSALGEFFRFHGPVTCIGVYDDGTRAKFGGPITRSDDPTIPVGVFMWFTVVDNGNGGSGVPDRSSILGIGDEAANEAFCASDAPPNARFSADVNGDIRVSGGG
ncbi:MAG TPA: hypothetical protein VMN78_06315 [Longimicrobiales bacterium]|nr:hypothetical protein [Longimicrobiales bacterium]